MVRTLGPRHRAVNYGLVLTGVQVAPALITGIVTRTGAIALRTQRLGIPVVLNIDVNHSVLRQLNVLDGPRILESKNMLVKGQFVHQATKYRYRSFELGILGVERGNGYGSTRIGEDPWMYRER